MPSFGLPGTRKPLPFWSKSRRANKQIGGWKTACMNEGKLGKTGLSPLSEGSGETSLLSPIPSK